LEELRNLFDSLDKDHDGKVTGQEWGKKVKEHQTLLAKYFGGSTLKEIGGAFKRIDTDGNASLSWDEFVAASGLVQPAAPELVAPSPVEKAPEAAPVEKAPEPAPEEAARKVQSVSPEIAPEPQQAIIESKLSKEEFKEKRKKRMSVHRVKTKDPLAITDDPDATASTSGLSYAVSEYDPETGFTSRKSVKILDGIAAEALAAVLGVDADVLNSLTEHEEIEDATGDSGAIIAVPDDFNVVFELATKMNLKEVRVAETVESKHGPSRRKSFFQKAELVMAEEEEELKETDDMLQLQDVPGESETANRVLAVTQGSAVTERYTEGGEEITKRTQDVLTEMIDETLAVVGMAHETTVTATRANPETMVTTHTQDVSYKKENAQGVEEGTVERNVTVDDVRMVATGIECTDRTMVDSKTGEEIKSRSDKVNVVDNLTGTVNESEKAIVVSNDTTTQSTTQSTSATDLGVTTKTKDASYEVTSNVDGALVSTGSVHASVVADTLTGSTTQEVSKTHDEAGVVTQEHAKVSEVKEGDVVRTAETNESLVNDASGVLSSTNAVMTKTVDNATGNTVQDLQMTYDQDGVVSQISAQKETTIDALGIMDTVETKSYMINDADKTLGEGKTTTRTVEDTFTGKKALASDEYNVDQDGIVTTVATDTSLVATESGFTAVTDMQKTTADEYGVISEERVQSDTVGDALGETTILTTLKDGLGQTVTVKSVANTSYELGITDVTEDVQMATIKPDGVLDPKSAVQL
jgi:hypothetical protein